MKEDIVKAVFIKYLQNLGKAPKLRKKNVPGPDIIIEGNAYECKGSKFKKDILFNQLISNGIQYSRVGVVIPWDALDCLFIHQLEALELLIREHPNLERSIEVYVIVQEDNNYFLYRWSSVRSLSLEVDRTAYEVIREYVQLSPEEKELNILEFLGNFDEKLREHVKNVVIEKSIKPSNRWEAFSCTLDKV
jgi:hypothetical protein